MGLFRSVLSLAKKASAFRSDVNVAARNVSRAHRAAGTTGLGTTTAQALAIATHSDATAAATVAGAVGASAFAANKIRKMDW